MVSFQIRRIKRELLSEAEKAMSNFARIALLNLVAPPSRGGTPRKTGWAASNWVISVGRPSTEVIGSKTSVSFIKQNTSLSLVKGYRVTQGAIYLSNNAPHIEKLNAGSSTQAPANFVQAALAKARVAAQLIR